jgi:hypothetical protein
VVALSGLVAEADAYGRATGASADLALLDQLLLRATPPIEARAQQDTARFAALMAWTIQRKHARALDALCAALGEGEPLGACLRAAEAAERVGDGGDSTSSSA